MLIKFIICLLIVFSSFISFAEESGKKEKPQLILLKSYYNQKNIDVKDWLMSEKLDGVRAYWDGHALYSRNGKRFAAPDWFIKSFPEFELDGELWTKRSDFEHIVSIVNQHKAHDGWNEVRYQIFEVPNAHGDFVQRLNKIKQYLKTYPSLFIEVIPQQICTGETHLNSFLAQIEQLGGEGVVVRNPQMPYHTGRSYSSLKVKSFQDAECRVTGYKEGKGKYKGLTGALFCQIEGKNIITIGSGLTDKERKYPPAIGSIITYKHYGYTAKGNPRFPVYLRIRKSL
ncbi:MAG: DNA ligase [Gammaproteobacteria bacterium]|nr:DNA ligase [Gammaproteobacteria bacterium]